MGKLKLSHRKSFDSFPNFLEESRQPYTWGSLFFCFEPQNFHVLSTWKKYHLNYRSTPQDKFCKSTFGFSFSNEHRTSSHLLLLKTTNSAQWNSNTACGNQNK
ncbi:hypothetical protein YC2023_079631 [Brassica napus]